MVELYQDTLIDLLLPKNAKRSKLEIKKDAKVLLEFAEINLKLTSYVFDFDIYDFRLCYILLSLPDSYLHVFNCFSSHV